MVAGGAQPANTDVVEEFTGETSTANVTNFTTS
jgi:hypothetical protein